MGTSSVWRVWVLLAMMAGGLELWAADVNLAPIYETVAPSEFGPSGWRALGPFFDHFEYENDVYITAILRPLYSRYYDEAAQEVENNVLWPLIVEKDEPERYEARWGLAFRAVYNKGGDREKSIGGVIPVLAAGKTGDKRFFALFPLGGNFLDFAGFDEIVFVLWPLYYKATNAQMVSQNVLWPIFSWTRKNGDLLKWRVFPLAGVSRTEKKTQKFFLWPFVHTVTAQKDDKSAGGWFVFPLGGRFTEKNAQGEVLAQSWTVLWPLFSGASGYGRKKLNVLWPFFQFESQVKDEEKTRDKRYFWPFFGSKKTPQMNSSFVLWPFWQKWTYQSRDSRSSAFYLLPFYWQFKREAEGREQTYRQLWPLFNYLHTEDSSRLAVLGLWPHRPRVQSPVQRNYTPLWTLYTRSRNADTVRHDLLWGLSQLVHGPEKKSFYLFPLVNYESDRDHWEFSLLKGFFSIGTAGETKRRLFWIFPW